MKSLLSMYLWRYPTALTYMLQGTDYRVIPYLKWFWRTNDFSAVIKRRDLVLTVPAKVLRTVLRSGMFLQFSLGFGLVLQWLAQGLQPGWQIGLALVIAYPVVWAHLIVVPVALGQLLIIAPRQRRAIKRSAKIFASHPGKRIAIVGSYGKTSMKELLLTVLSEAKNVAATPSNKNVAVSHAVFAGKLTGNEDILLIEYGEGQPGDVLRLARQTQPTHAVITGLAPAHLDRYKTLRAAGQDIFSISMSKLVKPHHTYVNADSADAQPFITGHMQTYSAATALGWKIKRVRVTASGTDFIMQKTGQNRHKLMLHSGLLGRHNVGPLALAAALALEFGLTDDQVVGGIANVVPYEHRMQPRYMNGALLIDDTYNGNLEGIRAGTALLHTLPATRKWYITPGLVDQGQATAAIHHQMGKLIAAAKPDIVVLMQNSVQQFIEAGLKVAGYQGEVRIESNPLAFYTSLPHFVAAGDVIMMQNDWTDNYA